MIKLPVKIKRGNHHYDILVGDFLSMDWPAEIERLVPGVGYFAVLDRQADEAHRLRDALANRKGWWTTIIEAGETHKTLRDYGALCESLIAGGVSRGGVVVAAGGGVVGDLAGFAAASVLRGVRLIQMPTTLMAQVDSSVGGKTGINLAGGKNLLGAYHQPEAVIVDPAFLATLPEREYRSGLAEVVKYGLIADKSFFRLLEERADPLGRRDQDLLAKVTAHCCRMKARLVGADERDRGKRMLLNYGHTFGHALEALAGYDGSLLHGEAVAAGMALAAAFAEENGLAKRGLAECLAPLFRRLGIPACLTDLPASIGPSGDWRRHLTREAVVSALAKDKKMASASLTLPLLRSIGDCRLEKGVPTEKVADFILRAK